MGIEPTYLAWKASVLPLNYTRKCFSTNDIITQIKRKSKCFFNISEEVPRFKRASRSKNAEAFLKI